MKRRLSLFLLYRHQAPVGEADALWRHGLRPAQDEADVGGEQSREDLLHPEEAAGGDQGGRGLHLPLPGLPHWQRR